MNAMSRAREGFMRNIRYWTLGGIIISIVVIFSLVAPSFFTISTAMNTIRQTSTLAIIAIGMTFIILTGGIDLSVGSNVAFSGVIGAILMQQVGGLPGALLGIAGCMVAGMTIGLINGLCVGVFRISPFMTTLATMSLARGLTMKLTSASRIMVDNDIFNWIGQKDIIGLAPGKPGVPGVLLLIVCAYVIANIVMKKTMYGRRVYAVGGNIVASMASGIFVKRQVMMAYVIAGLLTGIGSIIVVGRVMSAQPLAGIGLEFQVITAVVIGGTSLQGGEGSLMGSLLGAAMVGIISTGLGMVNVAPFINYIVKGVLILVAVLMDRVTTKGPSYVKKEKKKITFENAKAIRLIKKGNQKELELNHIFKTFPGVKALDDVSFKIKRGSVHALVGENGAGKSTLMKVLSGVFTKDSGEILIDGIPVNIHSPIDSQHLGISVIYQEFSLVPELNIAQNVFLGKEILSKLKFTVDSSKMKERSEKLLERFDLKLNVGKRVNDYTVGQQQMVEIAKSLGSNSWIIVMDEPTSAITESDKERLFKVIRELKEQGFAIVYISHRMPEIFEIADEVTVLRDGQHVITAPIDKVDENALIKHMVGRDLSDIFNRERVAKGKVVLEVKDLYKEGVFEPISFTVSEGEVLGFSGLMGAGRTEIMRCLFGLDKPDGGKIFLDGKEVDISSPFAAIKSGIALVSEDRRREGIVPGMTIRENISLPSLPWINKGGFIDFNEDNKLSEEYIDLLDIKATSKEQLISNLSGGNQQKCCLAKWLARKPRVLIFDEPTRGIDVGAKSEIHKLIEKLAKDNIAVIMISSELPEVMGVSDKIIVLHEGQKTGDFNCDDKLTQEMLMIAATGIENKESVS